MTKEELWKYMLKTNPALKGQRVSLATASLRKLFDLVWDIATDAERDVRAETDSIKHADLPPVLAKIFGGLK